MTKNSNKECRFIFRDNSLISKQWLVINGKYDEEHFSLSLERRQSNFGEDQSVQYYCLAIKSNNWFVPMNDSWLGFFDIYVLHLFPKILVLYLHVFLGTTINCYVTPQVWILLQFHVAMGVFEDLFGKTTKVDNCGWLCLTHDALNYHSPKAIQVISEFCCIIYSRIACMHVCIFIVEKGKKKEDDIKEMSSTL